MTAVSSPDRRPLADLTSASAVLDEMLAEARWLVHLLRHEDHETPPECGWPEMSVSIEHLHALFDLSPHDLPGGGADLIATERRRQVEVEGFTVRYDVWNQRGGWLLDAAACYVNNLRIRRLFSGSLPAEGPGATWPWEPESWKPTPDDPVRQLVKAGALIAAEIDRLLAEGAKP